MAMGSLAMGSTDRPTDRPTDSQALIGRGVAVEKPLLEKRNEKNLYRHARAQRAGARRKFWPW